MRFRIALCLFMALIFAAPGAFARTKGQDVAVAAWRMLTTNDVEAAHALLADNDPAVVPAVGDKTFRKALGRAYAHALVRAKTVTNYPGYIATMGEFANAMGDGHIWSRPRYAPAGLEWAGIAFAPPMVKWAGLVVAKRQSRWVIAKEDRQVAGADLIGARLIACEGTPIQDFARDTLGRYRVVWSVAAMRVLAAPWLLVDDGNPFVTRPASCTVRVGGHIRNIVLHWKSVSRNKFLAMIRGVHGNAGFGVRAVGSGYWISIQSLSVKAQAVIDAAKAKKAQLHAAPYVVVDLRGNSGGDDAYGRALADVLYGAAHVEAVLGPKSSISCPEVWRASPGNIAADTVTAKEFAAIGETAGAKQYRKAVDDMRTALADHHALTAQPVCAPQKHASAAAPSRMKGRVIVLTDSVCFSSCIGTVRFFEKLGATLAGQTTGADTHYAEVRQIVLPSGLSTFSTLQAIMPDVPRHVGPYVPAFPYDGDITDTAALERWIAHSVVPALHKPLRRAAAR